MSKFKNEIGVPKRGLCEFGQDRPELPVDTCMSSLPNSKVRRLHSRGSSAIPTQARSESKGLKRQWYSNDGYHIIRDKQLTLATALPAASCPVRKFGAASGTVAATGGQGQCPKALLLAGPPSVLPLRMVHACRPNTHTQTSWAGCRTCASGFVGGFRNRGTLVGGPLKGTLFYFGYIRGCPYSPLRGFCSILDIKRGCPYLGKYSCVNTVTQ